MKKELEKNRLNLNDAGVEILGLNLININIGYNRCDIEEEYCHEPPRITFYGVYGDKKDRQSATNVAVECYLINYEHNYWYRYQFEEAVKLYNFLVNEKLPNLS
jgi:hypothetical protein